MRWVAHALVRRWMAILPLFAVSGDCGRPEPPGNEFGPCHATDETTCAEVCDQIGGVPDSGSIAMNCEPAGVWGLAYLSLEACEADDDAYPQDGKDQMVPGTALEYVRCCCEEVG